MIPSRKADRPIVVQIPGPAQDRPSWNRVGILAAVGFLVGIAWPRFTGVRLGPSLPETSSSSAGASGSIGGVVPPVSPTASSVGPAGVPSAIGSFPTAASPPPARVSPTGGNGRVAPASSSPAARSSGEAAEGSAQVVWEVALVRDAPKTGKVIARLPRGVTIRVGPVKDGWYPVRYGEGFGSEGWVFRGAIGR